MRVARDSSRLHFLRRWRRVILFVRVDRSRKPWIFRLMGVAREVPGSETQVFARGVRGQAGRLVGGSRRSDPELIRPSNIDRRINRRRTLGIRVRSSVAACSAVAWRHQSSEAWIVRRRAATCCPVFAAAAGQEVQNRYACQVPAGWSEAVSGANQLHRAASQPGNEPDHLRESARVSA